VARKRICGLLHSPSIFQPYHSNQPTSSGHGTLQARIELQREKIRALELAAEERRRAERLRDLQRRQERRQRGRGQKRAIGLQRDEQR
jgi:hypothetical protein